MQNLVHVIRTVADVLHPLRTRVPVSAMISATAVPAFVRSSGSVRTFGRQKIQIGCSHSAHHEPGRLSARFRAAKPSPARSGCEDHDRDDACGLLRDFSELRIALGCCREQPVALVASTLLGDDFDRLATDLDPRARVRL